MEDELALLSWPLVAAAAMMERVKLLSIHDDSIDEKEDQTRSLHNIRTRITERKKNDCSGHSSGVPIRNLKAAKMYAMKRDLFE
jgi:ribosomal protein L19E